MDDIYSDDALPEDFDVPAELDDMIDFEPNDEDDVDIDEPKAEDWSRFNR